MSLAERAARNIAWATITNLGSRVFALFGTVIITRYLTPTDYGEVAIAITLVHATDLITGLGMLQYIVAKPDSGRQAAFHVALYSLLTGLFGWAILVALGRDILAMFDAPNAARYVPALLCSAALARLASLPERILWRDLRFATSGIGRGVAELSYTGIAVGLAIRGLGGMAIVIGNIVRYAVQLLVFNVAVDRQEWFSPCRLQREPTQKILAFGLPLAVVSLADNASQDWDNLLFSKLFGTRIVGLYNLAYNLADLPSTYIGEQIGDVLLPTFARAGPERRREGLVRAVGLMALILVPIGVGLASVARTAVAAIFDPRWTLMAPMLAILAALALTRPVGWMITAYLQANDQPRAAMLAELLKIAVLFASIVGLSPLGPVWTCWAVAIGFATHAGACIWAAHRTDRVPVLRLLARLAGPLAASAPMAGAVLGFRWLARGTVLSDSIPGLIAEIACGALVYVPAALLFAPSTSRDVLGLALSLVRRRRAGDDDDPDDTSS